MGYMGYMGYMAVKGSIGKNPEPTRTNNLYTHVHRFHARIQVKFYRWAYPLGLLMHVQGYIHPTQLFKPIWALNYIFNEYFINIPLEMNPSSI